MNTTQTKLADVLRNIAALRTYPDETPTDGDDAMRVLTFHIKAARKALAEALPAFDVLFLREVADEVFEGRTTTEAERFDQLVREIHEADPELPLTLRGCINSGEYDTFLVRTAHAGDTRSLRDRLQAAYDNCGVAGFFQIGEPA